MVEAWPVIHAERAALLADLRTLTRDQWASRSLCDRWTVRQVLAHIVSTARMTPPKFFVGMLRSGFSFQTFSDRGVARESAGATADQLAALESVLTATAHPPGPLDSWLGEAIIHAEDIRRPLGITRAYPTEAVARVARFYSGSNLIIGAKDRIAGVRLEATDTDWSHGTGPVMTGPVLALLLAMTGRRVALDDLTGDGVAVLRGR
jgi:uncharacterized protein (TIGR03083 family)